MKHSIQEITSKINAAPESIQQEALDFIEFMDVKVARQTLVSKHGPALLSEQALAVDWNRPKEDIAWRGFQ